MTASMRLLSVLCALFATTFALADPLPAELPPAERLARAKQHFDLARSRFELGDYDAAITEFKEAYVYQPTPLLLFNIAQAHRRAGRPKEAISFYERFLELEPDHSLSEWKSAHQMLDELRASQAPPLPPPAAVPPMRAPEVASTPRKRTWRWYLLGGSLVVAATAATILAVTLAPARDPSTNLGTFRPFAH